METAYSQALAVEVTALPSGLTRADLPFDSPELCGFIIAKHKLSHAPIHRLPFEILSKIFILCLPSWGTPSFDGLSAPLLLTQICSDWRRCALVTQRLWSAITISAQYGMSPSLTEMWMSRSKSAALWVCLDDVEADRATRKRLRPAAASLINYCDRWTHVKLSSLQSSTIIRLASIRHRLPSLQSLSISLHYHEHQDEDQIQIMHLVEYAPRLRRLRLEEPLLSPEEIMFPWSQLTHLHATFISRGDCLSVLALSTNLIRCNITCSNAHFALHAVFPISTLPNLTSFTIRAKHPEAIFSNIICPVLQELRITTDKCARHKEPPDDSPRRRLVVDFMSRCPELRSLHIVDYSSSPVHHLLRYLKVTPSLLKLRVLDHEIGHNVTHLVSRDFLGALLAQPDLAPSLESFEVENEFNEYASPTALARYIGDTVGIADPSPSSMWLGGEAGFFEYESEPRRRVLRYLLDDFRLGFTMYAGDGRVASDDSKFLVNLYLLNLNIRFT